MLCIYLCVIINTGVAQAVLYPVMTVQSASFTSSLFITASGLTD